MKKAYSYIRYSSPQQAKGNSLDRQLAATQTYCNENGYELDQELSVYKELGISGFQGVQENLKRFIEDCETSKIKKGSLLIVENLDRISRQKITVAMRQFLHILEYVDVYTTQDRKLYSHQNENSGDAQLLDIMTSLIIMSRAYNESSSKQIRLKSSWDSRRANFENRKLTTLIPHWLELNEDWTEFEIKQDRVEIIKLIYQKCLDGMGVSQLLRYLNENIDKYPTPTKKSKLWARTSLTRILTDRSVLGEYQPHVGSHKGVGESKRKPLGDPISDYYPQIINEELFLKVKMVRKSRIVGRGKVGKSKFSNLYRNILRCGYCDGKIEYVDKGDSSKGGKYLTCANAKRGGRCSQNKHYKYLPLELMLLHLITENGFMPKIEAPAKLGLKLEKFIEFQDKAKEKLDVLLESDFTIPAIKNKMNTLSSEIEEYTLKIKVLEDQILTFKTDSEYVDLYNDLIIEDDALKLYANRISFSSYLSNKIECAYLIFDYSPFILFQMKDDCVHTVILDEKYNFGGCTLPDGKVSYKRLNGDPTLIDERIWQIQEHFIALVDRSKNIKNEKLNDSLNKINKLISKIILDQNIELFDQISIQIDNVSKILLAYGVVD